MSKYRILSFDGGGILGTFSAALLKDLATNSEIPYFNAQADLLAGTSTGGLICLLLAHGLLPEEIFELYIRLGTNIYKRPWWRNIPGIGWVMDGIWAKYGNEKLREELLGIFGEHLRLGDLKKNVLITSFNLDGLYEGVRTWKPKFFHNFKLTADNDRDERVVEVALRTAAAPTFFPAYKNYVDGGVVVNNPSLSALLQTLYNNEKSADNPGLKVPKSLSDIVLLSIGTGRFPRYYETKDNFWGFFKWAALFPTLNVNTLTGMNSWQTKRLLLENFHRLNPTFSKKLAPDSFNEIQYMLDWSRSESVQADLDRTKVWIRNVFL